MNMTTKQLIRLARRLGIGYLALLLMLAGGNAGK